MLLEIATNLREYFTFTEKTPTGDEYRTYFRRAKPGAGLGWTQPRMEHVIGWVALCLQMCVY